MPRSRVQRPWIGQLPRRRRRGPRGQSAGFRRPQRSGVTGLPAAPGLGSRRISGGRGCRDHRTHRSDPGRASSPSPGTCRGGGGCRPSPGGPCAPCQRPVSPSPRESRRAPGDLGHSVLHLSTAPPVSPRPRLRLRGGSSWTCGTLATLRPLCDEPASVLCEEPGGTRPSRPCHPGEGPNAEDRDNPTHECRPSARPTGPRAS